MSFDEIFDLTAAAYFNFVWYVYDRHLSITIRPRFCVYFLSIPGTRYLLLSLFFLHASGRSSRRLGDLTA